MSTIQKKLWQGITKPWYIGRKIHKLSYCHVYGREKRLYWMGIAKYFINTDKGYNLLKLQTLQIQQHSPNLVLWVRLELANFLFQLLKSTTQVRNSAKPRQVRMALLSLHYPGNKEGLQILNAGASKNLSPFLYWIWWKTGCIPACMQCGGTNRFADRTCTMLPHILSVCNPVCPTRL